VTRYSVELDRGETVTVLRQNLDTSAAAARQERGRRVRIAWRDEDAVPLDTDQLAPDTDRGAVGLDTDQVALDSDQEEDST
jgi:hypothetical protein